ISLPDVEDVPPLRLALVGELDDGMVDAPRFDDVVSALAEPPAVLVAVAGGEPGGDAGATAHRTTGRMLRVVRDWLADDRAAGGPLFPGSPAHARPGPNRRSSSPTAPC